MSECHRQVSKSQKALPLICFGPLMRFPGNKKNMESYIITVALIMITQ